MVEIKPFKAITYTAKAGNTENLITQPYDKIDAKMQKAYYALSPYNYCRLILPIEENKYDVAKERIEQWLSDGIMTKESQPAIFVSRQDFSLNGKKHSRLGIIAAVRLYHYGENMIFPHEDTYNAPRADRLNMLRIVQKDLEPVFLMYQDFEGKTVNFLTELSKTEPFLELIDSFDVKHTIWKITEPKKISQLQEMLDSKEMVITDGHHRYESAVAYRDEMRKKVEWAANSAFNYYMCYVVPVQQEGLIVLPTHRLLKNYQLTPQVLEELGRFFDICDIEPNVNSIEAFLASHVGEHAFCVYDGKNACGLTLKHDQTVYEYFNNNVSKSTELFDVVILRDIVFKQVLKTGKLNIDETILYERWTKDAVEKINNGEASIAFLVNPIPAKTVTEVALKHQVLPEKSTDFYPKLVSGIVLMDISTDEKL